MLVSGRKDVEIRTWKTRHRGPILIHSSKKSCPHGLNLFGNKDYPLGCIVGVMEVIGCVDYNTFKDFAEDKDVHLNPINWYTGKEKGIVLKQVLKLLNPIPYKGQLGVWNCPLTMKQIQENEVRYK